MEWIRAIDERTMRWREDDIRWREQVEKDIERRHKESEVKGERRHKEIESKTERRHRANLIVQFLLALLAAAVALVGSRLLPFVFP